MADTIEIFRNQHYTRGIKLYDGGLYTEAIEEFEYVLNEVDEEKSPERRLASFYIGESLTNLARVHLNMGMFHRAQEELKFALTLHPDYADLHLLLAVTYYKQSRYDAAEEEIRAALSINPSYAKALLYLGLVALRTGNERGLADIASAVAQEPVYDNESYEHALALCRDGKMEEAIAAFEEIADIDTDRISDMIKAGLEALEDSRYDDATDIFLEAVFLYPYYADIKHYLGLCYISKGKTEDAIEQLSAAIKINPSFSAARMNLASVYEKQGDFALAIKELEALLNIDPKNKAAAEYLENLRK